MPGRRRLWKDNISMGSRGKQRNDMHWTTRGTARRMASALANIMFSKGVGLGQKRDSTERVEKGKDEGMVAASLRLSMTERLPEK